MLTFGSLFSGIGGFELGFENAGMHCLWQCEIDKACLEVLEKHWPDTRRYEDVRTIGKGNLEAVDIICGGFPCQDLSIAGRREGLSGERSGLWSEYA
jgi:DNA (cytosine-5)-methyltransferase 1